MIESEKAARIGDLLARFAMASMLLLCSPAASAAQAEPGAAPAVVELFTSQGCDSCPPADRLIGELADRADVVALTYNVDYWDYVGWPDTFASAANTKRQKAYARAARRPDMYTPQIVINGERHVVGSDRAAVEAALDATRNDASGIAIEIRREDGRVTIQLPESQVRREATVWLVRFDRERTQQIGRGENAGRWLTYHNVVRDFWSLGLWLGSELRIVLDESLLAQDDADGCAILVQERSHGRILGAYLLKFAAPAEAPSPPAASAAPTP